jgi:sugar/nucleoside kinase (ribokinase family)
VSAPFALILGRLQRDTLITADNKIRVDQLGGNLLYAAAACRLWGMNPGLVARIGAGFPPEQTDRLNALHFDLDGIRRLDGPLDQRRFIAYSDLYTAHRDHPIRHFGRLGAPLPKTLLGYEDETRQLDQKRERNLASLRAEDLPSSYHGAEGAHVCAMDFHSHRIMPAVLRAAGVQTVTLEASAGYMNARFWSEIPDLVNGLSAFIAEEVLLRTLFAGRSEELWDMIELIGSFNCQSVVVRTVARGTWVYQSEGRRRHHLPAYPSRVYDITDSTSSFCGALLPELLRTGDLVRAVVVGSATASLAVEGSGALYTLDTLPGLAQSRAQALEQGVRKL